MNKHLFKNNTNLYIRISFSILIFVFSLYILPFYQLGDQYYYNFYYTYIGYLDNFDGIKCWSQYEISTGEPIYIFLSWLFSKIGVSHVVFISLSNAILTWIIISIMQLKRFNTHIIILLLLLLNFYFMMFLFSAERLKFAMIFVMLYILYKEYRYSKFFLLLAMLSHFQIIIGYVSYLIKEFIFHRKKLNWFLILLMISLIYLFLGDSIYNKAYYYISRYDHNINVLYKSFVFCSLAVYYSDKKKETMILFIPLFIAIYLLSGDRLNVFAYLIFLYYALPVNRGLNVGIITTSIYFLYKLIGFLNNIIIYGDGFYR